MKPHRCAGQERPTNPLAFSRPWRQVIRFWGCLALTALGLFMAPPSWAQIGRMPSPPSEQTIAPVRMSGLVLADRGRILIKASDQLRFEAEANGTTLTLRFSAPIQTDIFPLLGNLNRFISRSQLSNDRRALVLNMTAPYPIRPFQGATLKGVDLLITPGIEASMPAAEPAPSPLTSPRTAGTAAATPNVQSNALSEPAPSANTAQALSTRVERIGEFVQITFRAARPGLSYQANSAPDGITVTFPANYTGKLPAIPLATKDLLRTITTGRSGGNRLTYQINTPVGVNFSHRQADPRTVIVEILPPFNLDPIDDLSTLRPTLSGNTKRDTEEEAESPKPAPAKPKPVERSFRETPAIPMAKPTPPQRPEPDEHERSQAAQEETPATEKESKPVAETSSEAEAAAAAEIAPTPTNAPIDRIIPLMEVNDGVTTLSFPWDYSTAAAVTIRNGTGWIIFNAPSEMMLAGVNRRASPHLATMKQHPHESYTILSFRHKDSTLPTLSRKRDRWTLTFNKNGPQTPQSMRVDVEVEEGKNPAVFIPVAGFGNPVEVNGTPSGKPFIAVPIFAANFGIVPPRRFVEFALPRTQQGIIIEPFSDDIAVREQRDGIRITNRYGMVISPDLPKPEKLESDDYLETGTFFPYTRWKPDEESEEGFFEARHRLLHDIAENLDTHPSPHRLKMAQLYMAEGLFREARAGLEHIEKTDPDFAKRRRLNALKGISEFMLGNYKAAVDAFNDPVLKPYPEIDFWKMLARVGMKDWKPKLALKRDHRRYLDKYPPKVRQAAKMLLAEKFIEDNNTTQALAMIEQLGLEENLEGVEALAQFYLGHIAARTNRMSLAQQYWAGLAQDVTNPFARVQAQMALTEMLYKGERINAEDALKRLDPLRIIWRGDMVEAELLRVVGQLNLDIGNYAEALRAWRELVTYYPKTKLANTIANRMTDVFIDLFNRGGADEMAPLEALTLYYEFRELTPLGREGDVMIQGLADRLAKVDLLERAAALLTHQVRYRLRGEERAQVGARLALLHLLNGNPELALDVLDATDVKDMKPKLRDDRELLQAEALLKSGRALEALPLISSRKDDKARRLGVDILWELEEWSALSQYLRSIIDSRLTNGDTADQTMLQDMLRLVLAQQFAKDTDGLAESRAEYESIIKDTPLYPQFQFITEELTDINHTTVKEVQKTIETFQSFIDQMRGKVRDEGLSEAIE